MSSDRMRFGIVGCGTIGKHHAKAISTLAQAELAAVCDVQPERAQQLAQQFGCDADRDFDALLARDDIQAVSVCTPSGLHAEHGIAAAQAGKHVLSEKPLDIALDKIDRLIAVCEQQGVKLACIFQHRFDPDARRVKRAIEEGKFGQLLLCNTAVLWYRAQTYYDRDAWRGTWALDGGVLSNQAIHYLDQMLWLMGEVEEVTFAQIATRARRMEAEDIAQATVRFANGAWGAIQASTLTWPGATTRVEVYGTTGAAVLDADNLTFYQVEGEEKIEAAGAAAAASLDPAVAQLTGHDAQIADFIAAVRENRDPYVTGREARRSVALLTDIYRQATGRAMLGGG
ncbi:MAG TPA: Gfo/Idh/MocA family oxidoreductase [Armatimonadota bacterium]|nr:Gfo/Idh/MocA family oxidoreductase [Armatimonadota bacterium]